MSTFDFWGWFDTKVATAKASPVGKIMTAQGWEISHTGGGCLAWEKTTDNAYVWICDQDQGLGDDASDPETVDWLVGVYSVNIDSSRYSTGDDVRGTNAALVKAEAMLANPEAFYLPES
jgi:hypothetical protein